MQHCIIYYGDNVAGDVYDGIPPSRGSNRPLSRYTPLPREKSVVDQLAKPTKPVKLRFTSPPLEGVNGSDTWRPSTSLVSPQAAM